MMICAKCGNELAEGANFCANCGAQIVVEAEPVAAPAVAPVIDATPTSAGLSEDDKEFLENTRRLLRWEKKAWKITGIAFTVMGGLFGGLFLLFSIIFFAIGDDMAALAIVYFIYALIYGAMFLGIGIVQIIAAGKVPYYLERVDNDFDAVAKRCGSIGMIVFSGFFGTIPLIFFAINFARIKSCKNRVEHIVACQKG